MRRRGRIRFEVSLAPPEEVRSGEVEIEDQGLVSSNIAILIRDTLTYHREIEVEISIVDQLDMNKREGEHSPT